MWKPIKTFFKQLFCSHIWKTKKVHDLGTYRQIQYSHGMTEIIKWKEYAENQQCLKCQKKRMKKYQKLKDFV